MFISRNAIIYLEIGNKKLFIRQKLYLHQSQRSAQCYNYFNDFEQIEKCVSE